METHAEVALTPDDYQSSPVRRTRMNWAGSVRREPSQQVEHYPSAHQPPGLSPYCHLLPLVVLVLILFSVLRGKQVRMRICIDGDNLSPIVDSPRFGKYYLFQMLRHEAAVCKERRASNPMRVRASNYPRCDLVC
jgi:hypothetical protein